MHSHFLYRNFSAVLSDVTNGFIETFSYNGSFRRLWMTWRRNNAESFILLVDFHNYNDASGTDTTQRKDPQVTFYPVCSHHISHPSFQLEYHDQAFPSVQSFSKHSAMPVVLSSATPSRPIPTLIIPGLKRDVNYIIVTLNIVLDQVCFIRWITMQNRRLDGMYLGFNRDMGLISGLYQVPL